MVEIWLYFAMDWKRLGRKGYMGYGLIVTSVCLIASTLVVKLSTETCDSGKIYEVIGTVLAYCGKFIICGTFFCCYIWTAEIFSTDLQKVPN